MSEFRVHVGEEGQSVEEVVDFLARIFGPSYYEALRAFRMIINAEPSTEGRNFLCARTGDGTLIGIMRFLERKKVLGSILLKCGCAASLGVHPEWRGMGVGRELWTVVHDQMKQRGMDISYIHGRRARDGYYTQFGYYGINRYLDLEIIDSNREGQGLSVSPFEKQHLPELIRMHGDTYGSLSGSIVRDEKTWNYLICLVNDIGGHQNIFECYHDDSQDMVGYFIVDGHRLVEICLPPDCFTYVPATLAKEGLKYISIHPHHPLFVYLRSRISTTQHERFSLNGGYMGQILNPYSLLSKMAPDICARARKTVHMDESVRLLGCEVELGTGKVSHATQSDDVVFKTEQSAIRFLLGIDGMQNNPDVYINDEKEWIEYLFPLTGFHTSSCDET